MPNQKTIKHTDIKTDGWIDRFMPKPIVPYMKLARFDRLIGTWLTLLPGYWGLVLGANGMHSQHINLYVLFLIGAILIRGAGCVVNDIWDRKLDGAVERTATRPLASGQISLRQGISFLFFLLSLSFAILLQLPAKAILIGCLAVVPICIYPLMKRFTYWPQLFLGLTFNLSVPIGWFSVNENWALSPFLLYIAVVFITIGYDTVYAFQDIRDDLKVGIKSTAIKFQNSPKAFVSIMYALGTILTAFAFKDMWYCAGIIGISAAWQIRSWDPKSPKSGLKIFKSTRTMYALTLIALLLASQLS